MGRVRKNKYKTIIASLQVLAVSMRGVMPTVVTMVTVQPMRITLSVVNVTTRTLVTYVKRNV